MDQWCRHERHNPNANQITMCPALPRGMHLSHQLISAKEKSYGNNLWSILQPAVTPYRYKRLYILSQSYSVPTSFGTGFK